MTQVHLQLKFSLPVAVSVKDNSRRPLQTSHHLFWHIKLRMAPLLPWQSMTKQESGWWGLIHRTEWNGTAV